MKKQTLGRGLDALIPTRHDDNAQQKEIKVINTTSGVLELDLTDIVPNDNQPRTLFDGQLLNELAESIKDKGVIQPIVVTKVDGSEKYMIIEGERRWRASGLAGKKTIPAIFRKVDTDKERLELALITNAQREDLNPVELARAYNKLMRDYNYRQEDLGVIMGRSRSAVANRLRLLNLPGDILQAIEDKIISEGHGKALLSLDSAEDMLHFFKEIVDKELNVREIEKVIQKYLVGGNDIKNNGSDEKVNDPNITALQRELESFFHTKVILKSKDKGGVIEIKYNTDDELDTIIKKVRGEVC